ncbi:hypothetical protein [Paraburkholderia sacchari]|uniref:hypothetical protein n=1 Tax=Paraburkholderia sacchari TaxID=159450 RepID=UPI0039A54B61
MLLATTMVLAVLTHMFVIGGNPAPTIVLVVITGAVTWLHRAIVGATLRRFGQTFRTWEQ